MVEIDTPAEVASGFGLPPKPLAPTDDERAEAFADAPAALPWDDDTVNAFADDYKTPTRTRRTR